MGGLYPKGVDDITTKTLDMKETDNYTEYSPGCYHLMIKYMAEQTGLSALKTFLIDTRDGVFDLVWMKSKQKHKKVLRYRSYDIKVNTSLGQIGYFSFRDSKRWDALHPEAEFISYEVTIWRPPSEFNLEMIPKGDYRDSLGGGWSQTVGLVKVNDQYFAPEMECAH